MALMNALRPKDLIALVLLGLILILDFKSNGPTIGFIVSSIVGYYFGRRQTGT